MHGKDIFSRAGYLLHYLHVELNKFSLGLNLLHPLRVLRKCGHNLFSHERCKLRKHIGFS